MAKHAPAIPRVVLVLIGMTCSLLVGCGAASRGPHWSRPSRLTGVRSLGAVSCPSASFCMAVGGAQAVAYVDGVWTAPQMINPGANVNSGLGTVSCGSAAFCMAGTDDGRAFMYDGRTWSAPTRVLSGGIAQISCAGRSCWALDELGHASFFNGSEWSRPRQTDLSNPALSCTSVGFCMAVTGTETDRLTGGRWVAAGSLEVSEPQGGSEPNVGEAVSCSSATFCVALDNFGEAFTWAGGQWSRAFKFDPGLMNEGDAVSCASQSDCVVVDGQGVTTTWNGRTWSASRRIDTINGGLNDVSCPTPQFCIAVDASGQALVDH